MVDNEVALPVDVPPATSVVTVGQGSVTVHGPTSGPNEAAWRTRWRRLEWRLALFRAANQADVAEVLGRSRTHSLMAPLRERLRERFNACRLDSADPPEDTPKPDSLWKTLLNFLKVYWAGEERRSKLSDTEWEAALQESATVVGRGTRGYKAWKELQDYLELLNFFEVPDDHPRRPDEDGAQKGEEAKELLYPLAVAYDL
eukprot:CAMPEP_0117655174 /NCGR_PEP_ID=MMETSP0804-20121206/4140_1 /TAXON_ID=1074897 /ORGANISM="Tetraselmis astigmatica, Strain CCMP880" /LENGTH=200 /DNA_ID=CAMNT_0005461511 /DNA_START=90 /DNA_END=692 /DNA_ORIENTATION=+